MLRSRRSATLGWGERRAGAGAGVAPPGPAAPSVRLPHGERRRWCRQADGRSRERSSRASLPIRCRRGGSAGCSCAQRSSCRLGDPLHVRWHVAIVAMDGEHPPRKFQVCRRDAADDRSLEWPEHAGIDLLVDEAPAEVLAISRVWQIRIAANGTSSTSTPGTSPRAALKAARFRARRSRQSLVGRVAIRTERTH